MRSTFYFAGSASASARGSDDSLSRAYKQLLPIVSVSQALHSRPRLRAMIPAALATNNCSPSPLIARVPLGRHAEACVAPPSQEQGGFEKQKEECEKCEKGDAEKRRC